jgi:hypothetical protein
VEAGGSFGGSKGGGGRWRLNTSLLGRKTERGRFVDVAKGEIRRWKEEGMMVQEWWGRFKFMAGAFWHDVGEVAGKEQKDKERRVDRGLKWRLARLAGTKLDNGERCRLVQEVGELQADLRAQEDRRVDGLLARLRAKWLEEGERPTKYLSGILKAREVRQSWSSVLGEEGQEITGTGEMLEEISSRWSEMWTEDNEVEAEGMVGEERGEELLDNWQVAKVGGLGGLVLRQVTLEEVVQVLSNVQGGSSPGVDGLRELFQ